MAAVKIEYIDKKFEYTDVYKNKASRRFTHKGKDYLFYVTKSEDWGWSYGCKDIVENDVIFYDPCGFTNRTKRRAEQLAASRFKDMLSR